MRTCKILFGMSVVAAISGCSGADAPTSPDLAVLAARGDSKVAVVRMQDACDPATFAGVPGGCQRNGGITFDQFIAQLQQIHQVPSWRFNPADLILKEGAEYQATNFGGEVHTFTEVEEFGGGRVPALNELAGLTEVAPECESLTGSDFIPPGASTDAEEAEVGEEHYQCCIHPWMRMELQVGKH